MCVYFLVGKANCFISDCWCVCVSVFPKKPHALYASFVAAAAVVTKQEYLDAIAGRQSLSCEWINSSHTNTHTHRHTDTGTLQVKNSSNSSCVCAVPHRRRCHYYSTHGESVEREFIPTLTNKKATKLITLSRPSIMLTTAPQFTFHFVVIFWRRTLSHQTLEPISFALLSSCS